MFPNHPPFQPRSIYRSLHLALRLRLQPPPRLQVLHPLERTQWDRARVRVGGFARLVERRESHSSLGSSFLLLRRRSDVLVCGIHWNRQGAHHTAHNSEANKWAWLTHPHRPEHSLLCPVLPRLLHRRSFLCHLCCRLWSVCDLNKLVNPNRALRGGVQSTRLYPRFGRHGLQSGELRGVVREGGHWCDDDSCDGHHGSGESYYSRHLCAKTLTTPLAYLRCRSMPLSYDLGIFRDLHLPLLLPPLLPLPIVVNINLVCGITARELGLTAPDLPATYAIHLVIIALAKRDARSVRLFSSPAQQPVRGASERDAGRRGVGISHRTLLTVVPSTDSQTQPLWEDKPPDSSRRWIAPEVREGSLVIVSCFCVWFCIMFHWSRTHCVSLHISIVLALGRQRPFERISIVALSPIYTSMLVCVIWSPYRTVVSDPGRGHLE